MAKSIRKTSQAPPDFNDDSPAPEQDHDLAVLCDLLQERGVTHVTIRYDGYGDSGTIEEIEVTPEGVHIPEWAQRRLMELGDAYCPAGYENNEGAYGTLTIFPAKGVAELEHYDRYEDSEGMGLTAGRLPVALRERLSQLGVRRIVARFDGYGDSGQFDEMVVTPSGIELGRDVEDQLDNVLHERMPGGWQDNDGSFGSFTVHVRSGRIVADAHWRTSNAELHITRWKWRE